MGEYARIQMAEDSRRMFGGEWIPEDFETVSPPRKKGPSCSKCGKKFKIHRAVQDHMRDKHKALSGPLSAPGGKQLEIENDR